MHRSKFTFVDLFAGIGGFHHALASIGGVCVMASELDEECRRVYQSTFSDLPSRAMVPNIRSITRRDPEDESSTRPTAAIEKLVPDHDVLCAGFPCQPFSKSGAQRGLEDRTRGTLFFDILQILRAKAPTYFILENVRNLAGPRHIETWSTIVSSLRGVGYAVADHPLVMSPHLLPPKLGGAPQVRERVFILGVHKTKSSVDPEDRLRDVFEFAARARSRELFDPDRWDLRSILTPDSRIPNLDSYRISEDEGMYLRAWEYFVRNVPTDSLPGFPIWAFGFCEEPSIEDGMPDWEQNFREKNSAFYLEHRAFLDEWVEMRWGKRQLRVLDFPISRQKFEWQARKRHPLKRGRTIEDLIVQFRPSGIRVKPATYVPALVAITQTSIVGPKLRDDGRSYRRLTPMEAGRLQCLPDHVYSGRVVPDAAAYKQLGNAVNSGVVRVLASILVGRPPAQLEATANQAVLF